MEGIFIKTILNNAYMSITVDNYKSAWKSQEELIQIRNDEIKLFKDVIIPKVFLSTIG